MQIRTRFLSGAVALAGALALAGCAQPYGQPYGQQYPVAGGGGYQQQGAYQGQQFGYVTNVQFMRGGSDSGGIVGTVAGGAIGGLAGHQVGGGSGRTAATIVGAVGGALIGRALEQNMAGAQGSGDFYRVTVQFDSGAVRTFDYAQMPNVQTGDRVRADGNQLYR